MTPREKKMMRVLRWLMLVWGIWPSQRPRSWEMKLSRLHGRMLLVMIPCVFCLCVLYIRNHPDADFFEKGNMYITTLLLIGLEFTIILPECASYHTLVKQYYEEVHLSKYRNHDEFSLKVLRKAEKYSFLLFMMSIPIISISPLLTSIAPAYSDWKNGALADKDKEFKYTFYMSLPFDTEHDLTAWIYCSIFNFYICCVISYTIIIVNLFILFTVIHTMGHIEILKHNFLTVGSHVKDNIFISNEADVEIYEYLKRITEHHNFIIRLLNDIQCVFGLFILVSYTYEATACCVLLLELSEGTMKSLVRYGPLSFVVFGQLIGSSVVIENMAESVNELSNAVYSAPWTAMSARNQKIIYNIMLVSRKEYKFKALGFIEVSLASMITILKSSISYFIFLKTMQSKV